MEMYGNTPENIPFEQQNRSKEQDFTDENKTGQPVLTNEQNFKDRKQILIGDDKEIPSDRLLELSDSLDAVSSDLAGISAILYSLALCNDKNSNDMGVDLLSAISFLSRATLLMKGKVDGINKGLRQL